MCCSDTSFAWYKHREMEYVHFLIFENSLVYCVHVKDLIEELGTVYNPSEWRLCIDASKQNLKAVLWHNRNQFASVPLAHSATMTVSLNYCC